VFTSSCAVCTSPLVLLRHFSVRHFQVLQIPVLQIQLSRSKCISWSMRAIGCVQVIERVNARTPGYFIHCQYTCPRTSLWVESLIDILASVTPPALSTQTLQRRKRNCDGNGSLGRSQLQFKEPCSPILGSITLRYYTKFEDY